MIKITTSKNSAWKAVYVYKGDKQIANLGIDPRGEYGMLHPKVFGRVGENVFRFSVPHLKYKAKASKLYNAAYQMQNRILHSLDGR